jgi:hypothetical protein
MHDALSTFPLTVWYTFVHMMILKLCIDIYLNTDDLYVLTCEPPSRADQFELNEKDFLLYSKCMTVSKVKYSKCMTVSKK